MEKFPEDFDSAHKPNHDLVESYSAAGSSDETKGISTGHKFFSLKTIVDYFPTYKLKRSGKITGLLSVSDMYIK